MRFGDIYDADLGCGEINHLKMKMRSNTECLVVK